MFKTEIAKISAEIERRRAPQKRLLLAISGPPASGKSTLAEALVKDLGQQSILVPMDGFHLDNRILKQKDLLPKKGAVETFDAAGFFALITRIKNEQGEVIFPVFDRQSDQAIAGAGAVLPNHDIVVIEGNYLLLESEPWKSLANLYDLTISLCPAIDILENRLIERWTSHDHNLKDAKKRVAENDMINAKYVIDKSCEADLVF